MREPHIFVWQWGRYGAGPRYAYELAHGLRRYSAGRVSLSLSRQAEIFCSVESRDEVDLPVATVAGRSPGTLLRQSVRLPRLYNEIDRFLRQTRPDIAVCAMPGIFDPLIVGHLRALGIPLVTIVHDASLHPGDRYAPLFWLQRRQIHRSVGIITLTDFVGNELAKHNLVVGKLRAVIPHIPFLMPDLGLAPPSVSNFPARGSLRLLVAGRLQLYKGLGIFVDALCDLANFPVHSRIVGTGNDPLVDDIAAMSTVEFKRGWCSEADLIEHIDWADVIVAPYVEASQSGIVSLALDRGRPVIATPVGGLPEQVRHRHNGLLADAPTSSAIARAIRSLLDDKQLYSALAVNAHEEARSEKSWQPISEQFIGFLLQCLEG